MGGGDFVCFLLLLFCFVFVLFMFIYIKIYIKMFTMICLNNFLYIFFFSL